MIKIKDIPKDIWNRKINALLIQILKPFFIKRELKNIIMMESHTNFDCNGGALYEYLIKNGFNKKYLIVWRVRSRNISKKLPENVVTVRDEGPSLRKVYYILNAKYFFSDDTMLRKIRKNQISVYCTHGGCTLKNVKGLLNVRDDVDYILSASENYDPIMCENYSIPFPNKRMLHFGFPSNDVLFDKEVKELEKLGKKNFDKTILWMPTFRKLIGGRNDSKEEYPYGVPLLKTKNILAEFNDFLKIQNTHLVVKLHPYQRIEFDIEQLIFSNITFVTREIAEKKNIDVYRLMASVDALISDYSSSAYSFILLDRPLAFILSDISNYDRGFDITNAEVKKFLPGELILNIDDLKKYCNDVIRGVDNKSKERMNWLIGYMNIEMEMLAKELLIFWDCKISDIIAMIYRLGII